MHRYTGRLHKQCRLTVLHSSLCITCTDTQPDFAYIGPYSLGHNVSVARSQPWSRVYWFPIGFQPTCNRPSTPTLPSSHSLLLYSLMYLVVVLVDVPRPLTRDDTTRCTWCDSHGRPSTSTLPSSHSLLLYSLIYLVAVLVDVPCPLTRDDTTTCTWCDNHGGHPVHNFVHWRRMRPP